ncbi:hypothetical protein OSB04_021296 [Centaurea solstitialis]|uniref:PdxS/SNZ N-terminal domain-containing protein n=1 Tax=Centaurea solstitialis TaxID=347529 RepID=A0AA38TDM1_9ASTR|nr:hypothetical protein OSB04_021296 [Centaurea solstitialis]
MGVVVVFVTKVPVATTGRIVAATVKTAVAKMVAAATVVTMTGITHPHIQNLPTPNPQSQINTIRNIQNAKFATPSSLSLSPSSLLQNPLKNLTNLKKRKGQMAGTGVVAVYGNGALTESKTSTFSVKVGLAQMLRGGVIMDVVNADQARIAEEAGACAVMALERVPADIRAQGGVARMSDPQLIKEIKQAVTIPVMAKARIGHFVEAQILEAIGVDYVDESEVLTLADDMNHINKHNFRIPFVCGCRNLGEALRRIREGAAMIRTKGEAGTGNIIEAVRHVRSVMGDIRVLANMDDDEVFTFAKKIAAPYDLVMQTKQLGRLPVVQFAAGGVATPADAALMMQLGCDGVFVGSGVFKSGDPARRARAIVQAVTHYTDPAMLAEVSCGLGEAMVGLNLDKNVERYANRSE